jgi:hypothetical protein
MKKLLLAIVMLISLSVFSASAQSTPFAFRAQGGYSWINGVVGAEAQFGKFALSGGWMPTKMPLSGEKISSIGGAITYYTLPADEEGYSYYASVGFASQGYRYELTSSWGYGEEETLPMTIVMVGYKYDSGGVNCKLGAGYGWCEVAGAFTFEITLGFTLFGN